MTSLVSSIREPDFSYGGKATNLFILKELGFRVPDFVVIAHEVLREVTPDAESIFFEKIADATRAALGVASSSLRRFAVRSSGIAEDGVQHSFAGQFETHLHVRADQLAEKIADVWRSARSERVLEYRRHQRVEGPQGIAVVVQTMLDSEVSGVAFGLHPVSGDRRQRVVSAVWGLGEGLVSGLLDADTFVLHPDGQVEATLASHEERMVLDRAAGYGTHLEPLPAALRGQPTLSDEQVRQLGAALDRLAAHYDDHPQDVEFAFFENELYLLQTRPVTTTGTAPTPLADPDPVEIVWDNSNIVESYPGITSPLTFSFILKMYEAVYRQFAAMMGVREPDIEAQREVFANMLGLLEGRVYYNLLGWYQALAMLPGYALNAEFMERMMGVKERFVLRDLPQRSRWSERLRVLHMVRTMLTNLRVLPQMRRDFTRDFATVMHEYQAIDFTQKTAWELMALYHRYEHTLLKKWKAPLVNDFFAMIYFGVLQKLVLKYQLDDSGTLHNDLLCGARDIVSTDPIRRCLALADAIQRDEPTRQQFLTKNADELYAAYQRGAWPQAIRDDVAAYLDKWGNRCVGELKLETVTYRQDPASFLQILKSYVEQGVSAAANLTDLDLQMRQRAEQVVAQKLRYSPAKRLIFNYFLRGARTLVSQRENLRYERTRGFGTVREMFCAIGLRFHEAGALAAPRDIFYLTKEEIFDFVKGTSVHPDLRALVAARQAQYRRFETSSPLAERIRTRGMVYVGDAFFVQKNETNTPTSQPADDQMKGLGCCPGVVRARVRVVHNPREVGNLNGDILVTTSTDPGWVTLFPTASGILVEKGSLLSHSAIVSREMGKPCVVGVTGLLRWLRSGDLVEMDGSTGLIRRLEASEAD
jgi:rifampicin phosphotransferase